MLSLPLAPQFYLDTIRAESDLLVRRGRETDLSSPIPSCPGWDLAHLVTHLGLIHRWVAVLVGERRTESFDRRQLPPPPDGLAEFDWFTEGAQLLVDTLAEAGTEQIVWTLNGLGRSGYWFRRMAQETLVHRVDVEQIDGATSPVGVELAADGIDEFWTAQLGRKLPINPVAGLSGVLRFTATDVDASWTIALEPASLTRLAPDADAPGEISGPAEDLLWFVWNRGAATSCSVEGDHRLADAWPTLVRL